ncbi:MAG: mandelate racemase/muconate lactonizing enzyme family protein [Xanthobacteraceae bacterium]
MPTERAYGQARGLNFRRTCALFVVTLENGIVGYGEAGGPLKPIAAYLEMVRPFFVNHSVFDFEIVAAQIYNRFYHFGVQNHLTACLGGISIAATDAAAKSLKIPAYDLLGGKAVDALPCYATTAYFTHDDKRDYEPQLAAAKDKFPGIKIKIGASPASDVERVKLARKTLGDDVFLMVDINGNYTVDIALESIRKIEPYNIHWCEEPLPPTDIRGYAELRARSPIPLAASEAFCTVHDFKRLIDARGVDIVQPSLTGCGGFGQAKQIAQLAQMNNLRVSPSVWGNPIALAAALHFSTSLPVTPHTDNVPYPIIVEYDVGENPLRDKMLKKPLTVTNGLLSVPDGPGLGIEIDEDALTAFIAK